MYKKIIVYLYFKYDFFRFPGWESFFLSITKVSDPAYAIAILFPVAASVNTALGVDILAVSVIAEWFNTLLKWFVYFLVYREKKF